VHRCLQNKAPEYLVDYCTPVSDIPSRRHLRSATRRHLTVPRYRLNTFGRRAYSVTRFDGLELATGQSPRPGAQQQQLQLVQTIAADESVSSLPLSTHSAVEMHRIFNSTFCVPNDMAIFRRGTSNGGMKKHDF